MSEPARRSPSGPAAPGWAEDRRLIAVAMQAVPSAFDRYLASGCDDTSPAAHMLGTVLGVIRHLDETLGRIDTSEAALDLRIERAVADALAAWPRPRRLRAL